MGQIGYLFLNENLVYKVGDVAQHDTQQGRWTCVDHHLHRVILTQWPGHLYKVAVIDFVSNDVEPKLSKNPSYTRALSYAVIEVMKPYQLFGAYGHQVCEILEWIATASYDDMARLGDLIHPRASAIYSNAWHVWLKDIDLKAWNDWHQHIDLKTVDFDICSENVIAWPTQSENPDSPINNGFYLISSLISEKAKNLDGENAWITMEKEDEDDEDEQCLAPLWSKANFALLHAAMGFGAKQYLKEEELECLTYAWSEINKN